VWLSVLDRVNRRCIFKNFSLPGNHQTTNGQIIVTITIEISKLDKAIVLGVFIGAHRIVTANQDFGVLFAPRPYFPSGIS